jgi:hypothetical protein
VVDQPTRRYSGKVTALIVVAIVAAFVVLNILAARTVPQPERPVPRPTITPRAMSATVR